VEVLLRRVIKSDDGSVAATDTALSVGSITIGSAAANTIQLLGHGVAITHATIHQTADGLRLRCSRGKRVSVDAKVCSAAQLRVGNEITIEGHRLLMLAAPAGFDCALQLEADPRVGPSEYESSFRTDLSQTRLSARALSWIFVGVALLVGLLVPIHMVQRHRQGLPSTPGLTDDTLWSAGPLSPAHAHAAGNRCGACHQQFFMAVADRSCRECHRDTNDHISKSHRDMASMEAPQRCATCHDEHLGEQFQRVMQNDRLCTGCHARAEKSFGPLATKNVSGFGPGGIHPEFNVVLRKISPENPEGEPYRQPLRAAVEQSNLKFSHAQHLDPDKVTSDRGTPLGCSNCHVLDSNSDRFKPITMKDSCAGCHELNFDVGATDRHLPHGNVAEAMFVIEDYFTRKYVDPRPQPVRTVTRRLPDLGRDASIAETIERCTGPAIACARERARVEIENQFTRRGCVGCHVVVDDTRGADVHERFKLEPVRITERYFPDAKFSHLAHRVQDDLTGDRACESCHGARKSTRSRDLLLPNVDRCLECHRDAQHETAKLIAVSTAADPVSHRDRKVITTQCTSCHAYHPPSIQSPP
jgi:predicted CXXCH cytochrome family protein